MTDMELKMSIIPIAELLPERAKLVDKVADLRARFSTFGTWDALRKIELSRIKGLLRAQATRDKRKLTLVQLDEEAHAHADYVDFVIQGTKDRAEWTRCEERIKAMDMTVNRGQAVAKYAVAELHLERSTT